MPQNNQGAPVDIEALSKQYGLDPNIVKRQIQQESGGKQSAVSPKGAIGTMQLMPETADRLGVDPYNKQENIEGGIREMSRLVGKYKGDYSKALAAYNAGEGAVDKANGIPDIPETQNYVKAIMGDKKPDIRAQTPDGKIHVFPAGTSPDVIDNAIRAYLKVPSTQTETAASTEAAPQAKGDVRPSNKEVLQGFLNPRGISSGTYQTSSPLDAMGMKPPAPTNPAYGMQDLTKVPINQFTGQYMQEPGSRATAPTGLPPSAGDPNQYRPVQGDIGKALTAPGMLLDPNRRRAPSTGNPQLDALRSIHEAGLLDVGIATG